MSAKTDALLQEIVTELRDAVGLLRDIRARLDTIDENTSHDPDHGYDDDADDDDDPRSRG